MCVDARVLAASQQGQTLKGHSRGVPLSLWKQLYNVVYGFGGSYVKCDKTTLRTSWRCLQGYVELGLRIIYQKACYELVEHERCGHLACRKGL